MKYRYLGLTDLKVSEIGFGGWGIGGNIKNSMAYGPTNDKDSIDALREAYECGINFFDTAPLYGFGHSEELIGKAFKEHRDKVIIATKVGYIDYSGKCDFSIKYIRNSLEMSLRRLKTDYIDIFQLHDISTNLLNNSPEIMNLMLDLKKEGKIKFIGISTKTQEESIETTQHQHISCMQINFNLVDQRAIKNELFNKCKQNNIGIIGITPLSFGFLTGDYNSFMNFHKNDHRKRYSRKQLDLWSSAYKIFLKELEYENKQTSAQASLRFCLSFPEVSTVIPGMINKVQVRENILSSDLGSFSYKILDRFKKIYDNNNFFIK